MRSKEHFVVTFPNSSTDSNTISMNYTAFGSAITIDSALDTAAIDVYAVSPPEENLFTSKKLFTMTFVAGVYGFTNDNIQLLAAQKQIMFKRGGTSGATRFVLQLVN